MLWNAQANRERQRLALLATLQEQAHSDLEEAGDQVEHARRAATIDEGQALNQSGQEVTGQRCRHSSLCDSHFICFCKCFGPTRMADGHEYSHESFAVVAPQMGGREDEDEEHQDSTGEAQVSPLSKQSG